jgi:hypothetical protein
MAAPCLTTWMWNESHAAQNPLGLVAVSVALTLIVFAAAAVVRHYGRATPGDLIAAIAGVGILALLLFQPRVGEMLLLPQSSGEQQAAPLVLWMTAGVASIATVAVMARRTPLPG